MDWTEPAATVVRASWRWSLVGNAVTVPVARWVGQRLTEPGKYDQARDIDLCKAKRWPRAARFDGRQRFEVEIGAFPVWKKRAPLHQFMRFPADLLSTRATAGFLARTNVSRLRFIDGFRERVRRHLERMQKLDRAFALAAD